MRKSPVVTSFSRAPARLCALALCAFLGAAGFAGFPLSRDVLSQGVDAIAASENAPALSVSFSRPLTDRDIEVLAAAQGVRAVHPAFVYPFGDKRQYIAHPIGTGAEIKLVAGRMPERPDECLVDAVDVARVIPGDLMISDREMRSVGRATTPLALPSDALMKEEYNIFVPDTALSPDARTRLYVVCDPASRESVERVANALLADEQSAADQALKSAIAGAENAQAEAKAALDAFAAQTTTGRSGLEKARDDLRAASAEKAAKDASLALAAQNAAQSAHDAAASAVAQAEAALSTLRDELRYAISPTPRVISRGGAIILPPTPEPPEFTPTPTLGPTPVPTPVLTPAPTPVQAPSTPRPHRTPRPEQTASLPPTPASLSSPDTRELEHKITQAEEALSEKRSVMKATQSALDVARQEFEAAEQRQRDHMAKLSDAETALAEYTARRAREETPLRSAYAQAQERLRTAQLPPLASDTSFSITPADDFPLRASFLTTLNNANALTRSLALLMLFASALASGVIAAETVKTRFAGHIATRALLGYTDTEIIAPITLTAVAAALAGGVPGVLAGALAIPRIVFASSGLELRTVFAPAPFPLLRFAAVSAVLAAVAGGSAAHFARLQVRGKGLRAASGSEHVIFTPCALLLSSAACALIPALSPLMTRSASPPSWPLFGAASVLGIAFACAVSAHATSLAEDTSDLHRVLGVSGREKQAKRSHAEIGVLLSLVPVLIACANSFTLKLFVAALAAYSVLSLFTRCFSVLFRLRAKRINP